ncbi:helix-turn-helix domain-containing protein [Sandaracinobacteroides saxicola]|uniref:Helix-turn-helix transcriptional regulator n=1 Tax=Sandaracinobacteroides saxicola TaxID=2759707 RepID=A0A7G5IEQ6_9SPHN|nr:helix-turn-helix transcriptional regulator [Sandaracinobacteroides saxicola]QMW21848.1 helix-turn-helix transcriptional regulator [Sandaracinobacteroides saxicola]
MTVQFITVPKGEELAVLPRREWEALVSAAEDAQDLAEGRAIAAAWRAGEIEAFPGELVSALVNGANPVRQFRQFRGVSQADLAARAGLSASYLSQIENGTREGTGLTLSRIATALNIDLELLVWDHASRTSD